MDQVIAAAKKKTSAAAVDKLTTFDDNGARVFRRQVDREKGKIVVPLRDLEEFLNSKMFGAEAGRNPRGYLDPDGIRKQVHQNLRGFLDSSPVDRRHLLEHFEISDIALKVVGVGL